MDRNGKLDRRAFILGTLFLLAGPGVARADPVDSVSRQLRAQGYTIDGVRRTLLGRVIVRARRGNQMREIVINPNNGVILRDFSRRVSSGSSPQGGGSGSGSTGGSGSGSGGGDDDNGDDDSDDNGDDGDDGGDDGGGDDGGDDD